MNGSVTITLEDYHTFLEASVKTKEARESMIEIPLTL